MLKPVLFVMLFTAVSVSAADLSIMNESDKTYDGGSYSKLIINNSTGITVRNCSFSASTGAVGEVKNGSRDVVIENCTFDGNEDACTGFTVNGAATQDIMFRNNLVENIADDGILLQGCSAVTVTGCEMRNLISKGTDARIDGPCYNGHSDGFELSNCHGCIIDGNLIYDIKGTSAIFFSSYSDPCTDTRVVNNLLYTPEAGYVVYIKDTQNVEFYHNTVWKGTNGGVVIGKGITGLKMYNNICQTINTRLMDVTLNANHDIEYNMIGLANQGVPVGANDVWAVNALFRRIPAVLGGAIIYDAAPEDFELMPGSPAIGQGKVFADMPAADFFGNPRSGSVDMGAIQSQAAAVRPMVDRGKNDVYPVDEYYTLEGRRSPGSRVQGIVFVKDGQGLRKTMILK